MKELVLAGALACIAPIAAAQVVINEFAYDDSAVDNVEFFELYNAGSSPVDISGWELRSGDFVTGGGPDNNPDYVIPPGTIIPPSGYWVIGGSVVPNVNFTPGAGTDLWENDQEWTALIGLGGAIVDAVAYETNKSQSIPAEIVAQIGPGIFGNNQSIESGTAGADGYGTSNARYLDGLDTNNNGRDFGVRRRTPGATNIVVAAPALPFTDNFNARTPGDVYPDWSGWFRSPRVIDPTVVSPENNAAIPASPDGGNALISWDFAGGGNSASANYILRDRAGFELWIYLDTTRLTGTQLESWSIGLLGTEDMVYNIPLLATVPSANGNTGIAWVFNKDATRAVLRLVDAKDGGNSAGATPYWTIYGEIDLTATSVATGWYRLRLTVTDNRVQGHFGGEYGDLNTGTSFLGQTAPGLIGNFYTGYRETVPGVTGARAVTMDALTLFAPKPGDANGDGNVDIDDFLLLAAFYETSAGDPNYNQNADFTGDGHVDIDDFLLLAENYER